VQSAAAGESLRAVAEAGQTFGSARKSLYQDKTFRRFAAYYRGEPGVEWVGVDECQSERWRGRNDDLS
jgi:hypothetical protein